MKKAIVLFISLFFVLNFHAQDTAIDFTQDDCNGVPHHLFEELGQGKAIILEFFMIDCTPCITAGDAINSLYGDLQAQFPGMVDWYHFGFTSDYDCSVVSGWVADHGYPSVPFEDGSLQVAYYGGFGMPTIVVVAGSDKEVIYSTIGWDSGSEVALAGAIQTFFGGAGVDEENVPMTVTSRYDVWSDAILVQAEHTGNPLLHIRIMNLSGQEVYTGSGSAGVPFTIDAHALSPGMYLVYTESGGQEFVNQLSIVR